MHDVGATAGDGNLHLRVLIELTAIRLQGAEYADLSACRRTLPSMARAAQRDRSLSRSQLLFKNGQSRCGMVKVMYCHLQ